MINLGLGLTAAAIGCSAADGTAPPGGVLSCTPGEAVQCACTNGSTGMQTCDTATGAFTTCQGCGAVGFTGEGTMAPTDPTIPTDPNAIGTDGTNSLTPPPPETPEPLPEPTEPLPTEPIADPIDPVEPPPTTEPLPEPNPDQTEVPATDHCAPVSTWDPLWTQWEEEVLFLVNERRAQGATCGLEGSFAPAAPLTMDETLRCSARLHSLDMFQRGYFSHTSPDGLSPIDRMLIAGYDGGFSGENIAMGQRSPVEVVDGWMGSDGHCANIMRAGFNEIGIGYHPGDTSNPWSGNYWTQNFGGSGGGGWP